MSTPPSKQPKTKRGQERRAAILLAAEQVIGTVGYAAASIVDITRTAGTAPGTFYLYFDSKEQIFGELVHEMGHLTRSAVARAVEDAPNQLIAEKRGLAAFLRYSQERPTLYRIVEEARFVDLEAYRAYYREFGNAYRDNLEAAGERGDSRPGDSEVRAWALRGMAKTLGEQLVLWDEAPDPERMVEHAFDLIENGLKP
jgi:AcrR family transcriptional regulator